MYILEVKGKIKLCGQGSGKTDFLFTLLKVLNHFHCCIYCFVRLCYICGFSLLKYTRWKKIESTFRNISLDFCLIYFIYERLVLIFFNRRRLRCQPRVNIQSKNVLHYLSPHFTVANNGIIRSKT